MGLLWSIINRPTAGETRRAVLAQLKRANDLKEREVRALEEIAKQHIKKDWSDDR
jgi:hypothetical protein